MDSVNVDAAERNLRNLETELENYVGQVENIKILNELIVKEIEISQKMIKVIAKHNKRLDPKFEFENREDFLKLAAEMDILNNDKKVFDLLGKKSQNDRTIKNSNEEIARIKREIPRAKERLVKAKGE